MDKKYQTLDNTIYVQTLAKRISYSRAYTAFYVSVILAALVEARKGARSAAQDAACQQHPLPRPQVVWILLLGLSDSSSTGRRLPVSPLFTVVETYVTVGLLAELVVRGAMQQRAFFAHRSNWADMAVAGISLLTSALLLLGLETPAEMVLAEALVFGRVAFRLMRLVSISQAHPRRPHRLHTARTEASPPLHAGAGLPTAAGSGGAQARPLGAQRRRHLRRRRGLLRGGLRHQCGGGVVGWHRRGRRRLRALRPRRRTQWRGRRLEPRCRVRPSTHVPVSCACNYRRAGRGCVRQQPPPLFIAHTGSGRAMPRPEWQAPSGTLDVNSLFII